MTGHLWLIGMMGVGKTTVGRRLAETTGTVFVDSDAEIAAATGMTIPDLWERNGERGFRRLETRVVERLATAATAAVIAAGGGAVLDPGNVTAMRGSGTVVWLTADGPTLVERTAHTTERPLLAGDGRRAAVERLLDERRDHYSGAAHHTVATGGRSVDEVAADVEARWRPT